MTTKAKTKTKPVAKTSATPKTVKTVAAAPASAAKPSVPAKRPAKPASKTPLAAAPKTIKAIKPNKIKMVRDSFTMPEHDYAKLAELKKKCLKAGIHVKKSELLRAGVLGLAMLTDTALLKTVEQLEKIKTGRPAKA